MGIAKERIVVPVLPSGCAESETRDSTLTAGLSSLNLTGPALDFTESKVEAGPSFLPVISGGGTKGALLWVTRAPLGAKIQGFGGLT